MWRCNFSLEELQIIFKSNVVYASVIDKTIIGLNIGEEIQQYLDTNDNIDKYAIIDDQIKDIVNILGSNHIIHCNPLIGFELDTLVDKALDILL